MTWTDTMAVLAPSISDVVNLPADWNRPDLLLVCPSMAADRHLVDIKSGVSVLVKVARPQPASVGYLYLRPEPGGMVANDPALDGRVTMTLPSFVMKIAPASANCRRLATGDRAGHLPRLPFD